LRLQAIAVSIVLSFCAIAPAQLRDRTEHQPVDQGQPQSVGKKPAKRGPRAIGVVEFLPKGGVRLVPIALWMDGKYYDASFYGANPEPMALQPETLYEALNNGEPTGWFTVTTPKQINGNWVADGKWRTETAFDVMQAHQASKQPKPKSRAPTDDDGGPPVLRRAPGSGSPETSNSSQGTAGSTSGTSTSASNAPKTSSDDSDRPTLKNSSPSSSSNDDSGRPTLKNSSPASSSSTTANDDSSRPTLKSSSPSASASSDDSDRPTLKNSSPPSNASSRPALGSDTSEGNAQPPTAPPPAPTSSPDENDSDRPTLQRGKPAAQPSTKAPSATTARITKAKAAPNVTTAQSPKSAGSTMSSQSAKAYPAISDAGVYETRSLTYPMTAAEREERGQPMLAMAVEEVRNYYSKRQQAQAVPKPTSKAPGKTAARPPDFVVSEYDLSAFDLDFSNSPTFVLTAKVPAPSDQTSATGPLDYFVTLVARVDINGQVQKVFSSVTDKNHLDAFPRLEMIGALDADANGRGDLLFRQYNDGSINYGLYRVYPYQMVKIFEGGAGI